jgi:hypothetical protein
MFISSYAPIAILLGVRWENWPWIWASSGIAVASLSLVLVGIAIRTRGNSRRRTVVAARSGGAGAAGYLTGYLLPFLTVDEPRATDLIAYGGFLVIAFVASVKTDIIQVNPLMFLINLNIFDVTFEDGSSELVISRKRPAASSEIRTTRFGDGIAIAKT